jgi:hypothetical protein
MERRALVAILERRHGVLVEDDECLVDSTHERIEQHVGERAAVGCGHPRQKIVDLLLIT